MTGALRSCPVCGQAAAALLWVQRYALFDDSTLPRSTELVACDECGSVFARSCASTDDYRNHYARHSKYDTAVAASGSGESPLDRSRIDAVVDVLAKDLPVNASIFDVGAGRGGILRAFRERGFSDLNAIDPSPGCVSAMLAQGVHAHMCDLEAEPWPVDARRFDLIVLSHVLEHVFDAAAALRKIARRLSQSGTIYVEVPDAQHYGTDGFPPYYFFDPEHINHFDRNTLCVLANRCGLSVTRAMRRDMDVGGSSRYPAIGVTMARAAVAKSPVRTDTVVAIRRYLEQCEAASRQSGLPEAVEKLLQSDRPIVVWGAGSHAQRILANTRLSEAAIDCIIDNDVGKQGRCLDGHEVVASDVGLRRAETSGAVVAIAVAIGGEAVAHSIHSALPESEMFCL